MGELTKDFEEILYVLFLAAPFVFITPFGPRGVLAFYIFMVLAALELLAYSMKGKETVSMKVAKPLIAVALSTVLIYTYIFGMNGTASRDRLEHLKQEVNAGA